MFPDGDALCTVVWRQQAHHPGWLQLLRCSRNSLNIASLTAHRLPTLFTSPFAPVSGVQINDIRVTHFVLSSEDSKLTIQDGSYRLAVSAVEANITFGWHWEKSILHVSLNCNSGYESHLLKCSTNEASSCSSFWPALREVLMCLTQL